eukprot:UN11494
MLFATIDTSWAFWPKHVSCSFGVLVNIIFAYTIFRGNQHEMSIMAWQKSFQILALVANWPKADET